MNRRAFTLIELLVVIAIIGLLTTIAVVAYTSTQKQTRNAKRIADIKQFVTAFNLGYDANGSYPDPHDTNFHCISIDCYGLWNVYPDDTVYTDPFFSPYLKTKPSDPSNNKNHDNRDWGGYVYGYNFGGPFPLGHLIVYSLETPASCGPGFLSATASNYIRCVVNLDNY